MNEIIIGMKVPARSLLLVAELTVAPCHESSIADTRLGQRSDILYKGEVIRDSPYMGRGSDKMQKAQG